MKGLRYAHLADWYDQLFPLDPVALSLVCELAGPAWGQSIVDAGCGTGLLAKALGARGYRVHGFDLDETLLNRALSPSPVPGVTFQSGDLRTFLLPPDMIPPVLMTCLGNTVPHLLTVEEIDQFLLRARRALSPGGRLLLQTLNYDHLQEAGLLELPTRELPGLRFSRRYVPRPDGLWEFRTELAGSWGQSTGNIILSPWKLRELEAALFRAGFAVESVWGGFDRRDLGQNLPLVILARFP